MRILGIAREPLENFAVAQTRNAGLLRALDRDEGTDVIGVVQPQVPRALRLWNVARYVYPTRVGWSARAGLNASQFGALTDSAERDLARWDGHYDVLLQLQTLFAPGRGRRPYAIYTDTILPLLTRHYREWAPLTRREEARWTELERRTCLAAGAVLTMSQVTADAIVELYGCDRDRVLAVGAGANSLAPDLAGKRWDRPVALFVGLRWDVKGGPFLLDAWRTVRARVPDAELWIVGQEKPRATVPGVRWLGVVRDRAQLDDLYRQAAVFALAPRYEAWGHVFVEALGSGVPVVSVDAYAIPEIVTTGETGLLVPPGDRDAFADALATLLADPDLAERYGRAGHERVRGSLTWDDVARRMLPALDDAPTQVVNG